LQVDSLKALDLHGVKLREVAHDRTTTSMRLLLPVAKVIS
jgi:hypothetical protein